MTYNSLKGFIEIIEDCTLDAGGIKVLYNVGQERMERGVNAEDKF